MKKLIVFFLIFFLLAIQATAATITITIPDNKAVAIIDSFATQYGYQETIDGEPNPVSKKDFTLNILKSFIKEVHTAAQLKAIEATRKQIITDSLADTDGITVE